MASIYEDGSYWQTHPNFHDEDAEFKLRHATALLADLHPASIADIGCGGGKFLRLLCDHYGSTGTGFDLSPEAIAHAQIYKREGLEYRAGAPEGHAALATMIDVFEHVDDYLGFLRSMRGKADYYLFNIPLDMNVAGLVLGYYMAARRTFGHLHYFSHDSALATLNDTGYRVLRTRYVNTRWYVIAQDKTMPLWKKCLFYAGLAAFSPFPDKFKAKILGGSLMVLAQ